jgi:hypothetical protein
MAFVSIAIENQFSKLSSTYKTVGNKHEFETKELTKEICKKYPFEHLGEYTKLFYDIDWDKSKDGLPEYKEDKELVKRFYDHLEMKQKHFMNEFVFTNGSYPEKFSFHVIFQKHFIQRIPSVIPRQDILEWLLTDFQDKDIIMKAVDNQVYSKNRKMRLPYGTCEEKPYPHIPARYNVNDLEKFIINPIVSEIKVKVEEKKPKKEEKDQKEPEIDDERKDSMMRYLELIKKDRFKDRTTWLELGGLMKCNLLRREDFLRFSKESGYEYYNEDDCNVLWYSLRDNKGFGFPKLQQWAEEDGIEWKKLNLTINPIVKDLLKDWRTQHEFTDYNIANTLYTYYKDNLYYTSQGWLHFDEKWKLGDDNTIFSPIMKLLSHDLLQYTISQQTKYKDDTEKSKHFSILLKDTNKLQKASKIKAVLEVSQGLFKNDDILNTFDAKTNYFCFSNQKAFDLLTNKIIDITPQDKILTTSGYSLPEENKDNIELVESFIKALTTEENYESLLSALSLFVYGENKNEAFIIFKGEGGNGKGMLMTLLKRALGEYYYLLPSDVLTTYSKENRPQPELAQCRFARCVMFNEPCAEQKIVATKLNELTGGDPITVRKLHKEPFTYLPKFVLAGMCNDVPLISGGMTNAIKRRAKYQMFPFSFVEKEDYDETNPIHRLADFSLKEKIRSDDRFRDGLIWLLLRTWMKNQGKYISCESDKEEAQKIAEENNPILSWLEKFEPSDTFIRMKELSKKYNQEIGELSSNKLKRFLLQAKVKIIDDKSNTDKVFLKCMY